MFILVKTALLLATLPVALPVGFCYHILVALRNSHLACIGFSHLLETIYYGSCFATKLALFPFFPIIHFFIFPPMVLAKLSCDVFTAILVFFTFPIAYLLGLWSLAHKFHMHLVATVLVGMKLLGM